MSKQSNSLDDSSLNIAFFSVLTVSLLLLFVFSEGGAAPKEGGKKIAVLSSLEEETKDVLQSTLIEDENALLAVSSPTYSEPIVLAVEVEREENYERRWVRLTAYSPLDPQAQEGMCFEGDPKKTASGTVARDGVVAANFLPFGTKIRIPSLFGNKIFTVEDRMSSRFTNTVDVVVDSRQIALNFGVKNAYIEILK